MSTMPPISSLGSAPVMSLNSPAALTPSIQSRRSLLAMVVRSGSIGLKPDGLDQTGVHVDLSLELVGKRLRRNRGRQSAESIEALARARGALRLDDFLVQAIHQRPRCCGRSKRADPELVVGIGEACL